MALFYMESAILLSLSIFCTGFEMWTDVSEFVPIIEEYKDCFVVLTLFENQLSNVQSLDQVGIPVERSFIADGLEHPPTPRVSDRHVFKQVRTRLNCYSIFFIYPEDCQDHGCKQPFDLRLQNALSKVLTKTEVFVRTYIHFISKYADIIHDTYFEEELRYNLNVRVVTYNVQLAPKFTTLEQPATTLNYYVGHKYNTPLSQTSISCKHETYCKKIIDETFNKITDNGKRIMKDFDRKDVYGYNFSISDRCRTDLPVPFDQASILAIGETMKDLFKMLLTSSSVEVFFNKECSCSEILKTNFIDTSHNIFRDVAINRVPISIEPIKYLTCDGVKSFLTFDIYIYPYDMTSWLFILTFSFIVLPFSISFLYYRADQKILEVLQVSLMGVISTYAVLLEQGFTFPPKMEKLGKFWRYPLGSWTLMGIVLTNAYKSLIVAQVSLPLPLQQTFTTFDQLSYFTMFTTSPRDQEDLAYYHKRFELPENEFIWLREPESHCFCNHGNCNSTIIFRDLKNPRLCLSRHNGCNQIETTPIVRAQMWPFHRYVQTTSTSKKFFNLASPMLIGPARFFGLMVDPSIPYCLLYEVTSNCYKTGVLGTKSSLTSFLAYVKLLSIDDLQNNLPSKFYKPTWNRNKKPVYKESEEELFNRPEYFFFPGWQAPIYQKRFLSFMASGIYNIWVEWTKIIQPQFSDLLIKESKRFVSKHESGPIKVKLDSNIITSFYILMGGVAVCVVIFLIEIVNRNWESLRVTATIFIKNLQSGICRLWRLCMCLRKCSKRSRVVQSHDNAKLN